MKDILYGLVGIAIGLGLVYSGNMLSHDVEVFTAGMVFSALILLGAFIIIHRLVGQPHQHELKTIDTRLQASDPGFLNTETTRGNTVPIKHIGKNYRVIGGDPGAPANQ